MERREQLGVLAAIDSSALGGMAAAVPRLVVGVSEFPLAGSHPGKFSTLFAITFR